MECSCKIDIDIDEGSPDFTSQKMVTARKDHKCIECRGVIKKGDLYEKTAGKWDGSFESFKTCSDCLSLRKEFFSGGYYYGHIWEDFEIYVDMGYAEISETCLAKLTPVARGRACEIIQKWWEDDDQWR